MADLRDMTNAAGSCEDSCWLRAGSDVGVTRACFFLGGGDGKSSSLSVLLLALSWLSSGWVTSSLLMAVAPWELQI